MVYVLIVFFKVANAGGMTSVEFSSLDACSAAGKAVQEDFKGFAKGVRYTCIVKE